MWFVVVGVAVVQGGPPQLPPKPTPATTRPPQRRHENQPS
eukprot:CAMPEP_0118884400 /NCGR_PEP_ID=MMETSP1163-20130328/23247_1 /TAXON_ID=124430 /ORGANISM="Phaeomonas parva, Strain CCMP2877" /LENGTH=39 /DNA_ID= /DNA_START= /DNA_END= /DNA_ORIENTATION=